ncbi:hypothetical protein PS15p_208185 [Mucor circinelloides]
MRTTFKNSGGYSPFFLTYGRPPRLGTQPIEEIYDEEEQSDEYVLQRIAELVRLNRETIPLAIEKMDIYKTKMKAYYDKRMKARRFVVGDLVMAEDRAPIKDGNTFVPKWIGPFKIHQRLQKDTYLISDWQLVFPLSYHANQLKIYKARPKVYMPLKVNFCTLAP